MRQELLRQRERLEEQIEQLTEEVKRAKAAGRKSTMRLADEAQRAHEALNESRRQVHELEGKLEDMGKKLSVHERKGHGGKGRVARGGAGQPGVPLMAIGSAAAEQAGLTQLSHDVAAALTAASAGSTAANEVASAAARGLSMSVTEPLLRSRPAAAAPSSATVELDAAGRPTTAPPPIAPLVGSPAPAPEPQPPLAGAALKLLPAVPRSYELSEQVERHMLENMKLREQLLHFTSKASKGKRKPGTLTMPLPPV